MSEPIVQKQPARTVRRLLGMLISVIAYAAAIVTVREVARNISFNPRTEDAQVRANVIGISSQVGGAIDAIHVKDNQLVHRGDLLMEIDSRPYAAEAEKARAQLALTELEIQSYKDQIAVCEAALKQSEAKALYAANYAKRLEALVGNQYVTADKNELAQTDARTTADKVIQDKAALESARNLLGQSGEMNVRRAAAQAQLKDAELKLSYCKVYAPCDGYITNLQITPGAYAAVGEQIFSLVDRRIWYVLANFRETDLRHIRPGMEADIYLLAESGRKIRGIVQGLPKAVSMLASPTKSTAGGEGILSQVSPTLDFILLAQRYPVRIVLDEPEDHSFRMGGTAAVIVRTESDVTSGLKRLSELQQGDTPAFISPLGGASTIPLHE